MKLAKFAFVCAAAASLAAVADTEYASSTLAILPVKSTSSMTLMPLTVNFLEGDGNTLTADKVIKTANLEDGAALYVYTSAGYIKYTLNSDKNAWELVQNKIYTVTSSGMTETESSTADSVPVARGSSVFLDFTSKGGTAYLAGMMPSTNTTITISAGANLIGVPKAAQADLNGFTWPDGVVASTISEGIVTTPGDVIDVPTSNGGATTRYYYDSSTKKWGKIVVTGDPYEETSSFVSDSCVIPAGQGFWYYHKGTGVTITW